MESQETNTKYLRHMSTLIMMEIICGLSNNKRDLKKKSILGSIMVEF